jgi:DNA-directed RNA polymerase subunit M/transcription elongation factor TFIIS
MKFCQQCNNFLYNIEERDKKAYRKCRSCPYEEEITKQDPVVYEHDLQQDTATQYSINEFIVHAPDLPTFRNLVCPNDACPTRGKESNIKGIKLDAENVMWYYKCVACKTAWKQLARGPS